MTVEVGGELGREGKREKTWNNCNRVTIKYFKKEKISLAQTKVTISHIATLILESNF